MSNKICTDNKLDAKRFVEEMCKNYRDSKKSMKLIRAKRTYNTITIEDEELDIELNSFCNRIDLVLSMLDSDSAEIIKHKYLGDKVEKDFYVYQVLLFSERTYYRVKSNAMKEFFKIYNEIF